MMPLLSIASGPVMTALVMTTVVFVVLIGHTSFWIRIVNMLHGSTLPHGPNHVATYLIFGWIVVAVPWMAWPMVDAVSAGGVFPTDGVRWANSFGLMRHPVIGGYMALAGLHGIVAIGVWLNRRCSRWCSGVRRYVRDVLVTDETCPDTDRLQYEGSPWLRFPGSQALRLRRILRELQSTPAPGSANSTGVDSRKVDFGLRILHLTDFHFGGGVPIEYYDWCLDQILQPWSDDAAVWQPDLVTLTGDFLDNPAWMAAMTQRLQRLTAPGFASLGVWFVLGNHDLRCVDPDSLRRALTEECGFHDLGGQVRQRRLPDGRTLELIGDESPWGCVPEWNLTSPSRSPDLSSSETMRVVLTHTPDRFPFWANRFRESERSESKPGSRNRKTRESTIRNLVLAGHTHGGQMCIPGIGAVLTPCLGGTTFVDGVYRIGPTLLHVNHGIAAKKPLRLFCPPEAVTLKWVSVPKSGGP